MVPLPRTPNVAQILDEYLNSKAKLSDSSDGVVAEVVEGLRTYFDQALGMLLLYRLERAEYTDQLNQQPDQPMSSVYGAEHLLRLFGTPL
ncbi:hypothetical protein Zmor_004457 [Zophobas morio]|uniref:MRG domain-containing protein n=1 Tax=Zophobas morio TaxID=2755281 RepID=A0AA38HJS2_9CUCU|nr:hypothetical protein Zmor_004457 [Zophobas morio]